MVVVTIVPEGWISLHRSIQDHWVWGNPKYLKWWLDLILMANFKENKIIVNGELKTIGIGERLTSEQKLADRWDVSRNTVRKFLNLLKKDGMISVQKSRQSGTTYKIDNYGLYQGISETKKHQTEQRKDNVLNNELNINNKENKENNKDMSISSEKRVSNSSKNLAIEKQLSDDFAKLWKLYPVKKGKKPAYASYKKAIKNGVTNKQIQTGIMAYRKEIDLRGIPADKIKYGSTWFNQESWNDEYQTTSDPQTTFKQQKIDDTKQRLDDAYA
jgi:DNA-binding transcriptional regulator YhcF (GntR family)